MMKKIKCVCGGNAVEHIVTNNGYTRQEYKCDKCGSRFVTRDQAEANSNAIKDRNIATYYN